MEVLNPISHMPIHRLNSQRRGLLFVISGPSGVGKGTIVRELLQLQPELKLSVSVTTRQPRPGEVEGVNYYFRSVEEFQRRVEAGEMLEYAQYGNNFYGTPRSRVEERLSAGRDILFDIDYQGTLQLYEKCRADMVTIFILPPSIKELRKRLERRAQDSEGTIGKRLKNARIEMEHFDEYDYVLVNEDLEDTTSRVRTILAAARLRRDRQSQMDKFVRDLQSQIDSI